MKNMLQNQFDRIPDDILRLILNRVHDAKSLCACLAVSTRFNFLATQSTNITLSVDRIHFDDDNEDEEYVSKHNLLRSIFKLFVYKPLRFLTRLTFLGTPDVDSVRSGEAAFYSPSQALKSFSKIDRLKIQLPSHGELQLDSNPLLKWKASFGSELKSCVIVAGTSVEPIRTIPTVSNSDGAESETQMNKEEDRVAGVEPPPFSISNEDLKARIVWTISCLIAAASRHHLLKRIVVEHPNLKTLEMVDENGQGTLTMNGTDITEMRRKCELNLNLEESLGNERSRIPALKMKMWHAAEVELPGCGKVMRGATLVVIGDNCDGVFDEEEMFGEVAREIRKKMKQSYSLEIESF